jgi:misacylated tRNA(Ala) deacylase
MTADALFRADAYMRTCLAIVTDAGPEGVRLNRTVFYPTGGGQPGDSGILRWHGGEAKITDTRRWRAEKEPEDIHHILGDGALLPPPNMEVELVLDWDRRYAHMRMHTCLHLLSALLRDSAVTGGQVGADKSRLDFDIPSGYQPDKCALNADLNRLIEAGHSVRDRWISDGELAAQPELIRTMSVKPPVGQGRVRLLAIGGDIDLQPCGGTHVKNTQEIGPVDILKIENKGRQNRRFTVALQSPASPSA